MVERVEAGDFYILCPDNDVPRSLDERRMLWAIGDIVEPLIIVEKIGHLLPGR